MTESGGDNVKRNGIGKSLLAGGLSLVILCNTTACGMSSIVKFAIKTAHETVETIQKFESTEETLAEQYQEFSKESIREWLVQKICQKEEKISITFANTGISDDDMMAQIKEVFAESIEYQYMCTQYRIRCSFGTGSIVCDLELSYRKGAKDVRKIKQMKNEDQLYRYLVKQNAKGKDTITFSYVPGNLSKKKISSVIEATFWNDATSLIITPSSWSTTIYGDKKTAYRILEFTYNYKAISQAGRKKAKKQVKKEINKIVTQVKKRVGTPKNNRKTHKAIYDILCEKITYDYNLVDALESGGNAKLKNNRSTYGALVKGKSVCSGYASAYKAVCDKLSLPCWALAGETEDANHAWNMIICKGKLYYIDVTFGDQVTYVNDNYFFVSPATYKTWKRKVFAGSYVPKKFYKAGYKA